MFGTSALRLLLSGAVVATLAVGGCVAYPDGTPYGAAYPATPYYAAPYAAPYYAGPYYAGGFGYWGGGGGGWRGGWHDGWHNGAHGDWHGQMQNNWSRPGDSGDQGGRGFGHNGGDGHHR